MVPLARKSGECREKRNLRQPVRGVGLADRRFSPKLARRGANLRSGSYV
jgi:hypothetical protein